MAPSQTEKWRIYSGPYPSTHIYFGSTQGGSGVQYLRALVAVIAIPNTPNMSTASRIIRCVRRGAHTTWKPVPGRARNPCASRFSICSLVSISGRRGGRRRLNNKQRKIVHILYNSAVQHQLPVEQKVVLQIHGTPIYRIQRMPPQYFKPQILVITCRTPQTITETIPHQKNLININRALSSNCASGPPIHSSGARVQHREVV